MTQTDIFHYPPELFELLIETIPLLNRSKKSVVLFFRGAGVPDQLLKDISNKLDADKDSINKYEIARTILTRINEKSDTYIRERRELLKRIVEFESFTNCWETDQYKAKGLVSEIRNIVNVKDSFTRMKQEKENSQAKHTAEYNKRVEEIKKRTELIEKTKKEFYGLFAISNPQERGKKLEGALNSIFSIYGILVREAFTRKGDNGEGIIEQVDGVIEIDNQIYLVEMKWKMDKIGVEDIFAHLGRIYHRTSAQGIFISASGFADSGIIASKEALVNKAILVLTDLEEFINVLDNDKDLIQYFKAKIRKAIIDKEPYSRP
ncbi:MAG TPA: restriction endonuclease [Phnomibacter sp.]|nr:restriction endonuclease [Phnomibacter sp.]